jgi:hypothetical protein
LQYYLYNWKCTSVEPSEIGLVLQWTQWSLEILYIYQPFSYKINIANHESFPRA